MSDNEIIKALECCKTGDCIHCPKWKNEYISGECNDILHFALNLINRQQAEIEGLKEFASSKCEDCAGCTSWKCDCANIEAYAKAEAIKEFAERLKCGVPQETGVIRCADIDNIVKEMEGGAK